MKTNFKILSLLGVFTLVSLVACKEEQKKDIVQLEEVPGINLDFMDSNVKPNDDFFKFVNGKWLETNEIPDDRSTWGSFAELRKKTDEDALAILKAAMNTNKDMETIEVLPGSDQEKAVNYFKSIMDTIGRDKQGIKPLQPYLAKIEAINNSNRTRLALASLQAILKSQAVFSLDTLKVQKSFHWLIFAHLLNAVFAVCDLLSLNHEK